MAMNLVQQGEDLQDFSDEALANELQTGQRGYLPVAVISEIERRTRDRQRYQQTMAAQQAEAPPVAEARLMEFMAQSQPSPEMGMAPEMAGMPPEMAAMPPQGIMAAQPEMAPMPAEAPAGIASMMPPQHRQLLSLSGVKNTKAVMSLALRQIQVGKAIPLTLPLKKLGADNEDLKLEGLENTPLLMWHLRIMADS
jgi:hypothetical protein